ncbi:MAG: nucleotidyltransferase family protein [Deltaproteobacteria bacterium]|nr:nucleotidyltransferase family protein [Deltaproteobacteria bacterium]
MVSLPASLFYGDCLRTLTEAEVPFVVGGAFALKHYAGVERGTKDLDVFLCRRDLPRALEVLQERGYTTDETFPHWLSKAWCGDHFVDFIHASANGLCEVDEGWFRRAVTVTIFDQPALLCPIEEMIWSKCFVMERERFDGADVNHLVAARGHAIDWRHLVDRFDARWRILLGHLVFFSFTYPSRRDQVPAWVMDELISRLVAERASEDVSVCNGTLLSREQYLVDIREQGYADARVPPHGSVPQGEIDAWTEAIGKVR